MNQITTAIAIAIGAAVISAAIMFSGRYAIEPIGPGDDWTEAVWRVDRITGEVSVCILAKSDSGCGRIPESATSARSSKRDAPSR